MTLALLILGCKTICKDDSKDGCRGNRRPAVEERLMLAGKLYEERRRQQQLEAESQRQAADDRELAIAQSHVEVYNSHESSAIAPLFYRRRIDR